MLKIIDELNLVNRKNRKLQAKVIELQEIVHDQKMALIQSDNSIRVLCQKLHEANQKIEDQQRRMRFFGIEIGNEEYHPDPVDFPSVIKL